MGVMPAFKNATPELLTRRWVGGGGGSRSRIVFFPVILQGKPLNHSVFCLVNYTALQCILQGKMHCLIVVYKGKSLEKTRFWTSNPLHPPPRQKLRGSVFESWHDPHSKNDIPELLASSHKILRARCYNILVVT